MTTLTANSLSDWRTNPAELETGSAYTTPDAVRRWLQSARLPDDPLILPPTEIALKTVIAQASRLIETACATTFVAKVYTRRYDAALPDVYGRLLLFDADLLRLDRLVNGDGREIPLDSVILRPVGRSPSFGLSLRQESGLRWGFPTGNPKGALAVTGLWGYSEQPPDAIIQTATRLAAWLVMQKRPAADPPAAIMMPLLEFKRFQYKILAGGDA